MTFNEANTVEAFIRDRLTGTTGPTSVAPGLARQGGTISGLGWHFVDPKDLPRQSQDALVEPYLRDALIRLNPTSPPIRAAWTMCSTACAPS